MYQNIHALEGCTIEYDDQRHVMRVTMTGIIQSDLYRQINQMIMDFARTKPVKAIVSNLRRSGLVNDDDQRWVAKHVLPRLVDRGLHYTAFVLPANIYAELSLKHFSHHLEHAGPVYQRYFVTVNDAERWIESVRRQPV